MVNHQINAMDTVITTHNTLQLKYLTKEEKWKRRENKS